MPRPTTLGYLLTNGYALIACCKGCRRFSDLDVLALSVRFGEDRPLSYLRPRLTCAECGHRGAELQIDANRGKLPAARH
jgi:hypothetical protein